jgi:hypothetical protein
MAEPKTQPTKASVAAYIAAIPDAETRRDCKTLVTMMKKATGAPPKMWGTAIVGFGTWRYTYSSGRTGDWPLAAFSPRKQNLVIYLTPGFDGMKEFLTGLGRCRTSKACLYVRRLADIDPVRLDRLIRATVEGLRQRYGAAE